MGFPTCTATWLLKIVLSNSGTRRLYMILKQWVIGLGSFVGSGVRLSLGILLWNGVNGLGIARRFPCKVKVFVLIVVLVVT